MKSLLLKYISLKNVLLWEIWKLISRRQYCGLAYSQNISKNSGKKEDIEE